MNSKFSLRDLSLFFALLAIAAFFTFAVPGYGFVTPRNLTQLVVEVSITATLAVGMLLVILPGHIDLSAGSGVGLLGGLATVLVGGTGWLTKALTNFHAWLGATFGAKVAACFPPPPWPDPVAMLVCLVVAMVFWGLMGMLVVRERIQAFIVTLGGMLIFKGLFWRVIESHTIPVIGPTLGKSWPLAVGGQTFDVPQDWLHRLTTEYLDATTGLLLAAVISLLMLLGAVRGWARRRKHNIAGDDGELTFVKWLIVAQLLFLFVLVANQYQGVPMPAVICGAVAFAVHTLTRHTRFGRYLYAIGGNEEAAVISGIAVKKIVVRAFVLMGVIVAITGFMQTAYAGYTTPDIGNLMELDAVAACVIGGVSLRGGRGTVLGVLYGALIMATLAKGMSLTTFTSRYPELKYIARGAVLILAVWMDSRLSKRID